MLYLGVSMSDLIDEDEQLEDIQDAHELQEHSSLEDKKSKKSFKETVSYIYNRVLKENITQVAGTLTYTTVLAVVPLLAVILSLFTAFPMFHTIQGDLQTYMTSNLMPESLSDQIMNYLNQFAESARGMTVVGSVFLVITSIMLMKTIDEVLNKMFRVTKQRPLWIRILIYWAVLSVGPFVFGASIWASTYVTRAKLGVGMDLSVIQNLFGTIFPFILSFISFSLIYKIVPNRQVHWKDALIGGATSALLFEGLKFGFTYYITKFPSYTLIYGTFATIPLFLLWIYISWIIILAGALLVALLPQLRYGFDYTYNKIGADFTQSVRILRLLNNSRNDNPPGKSTNTIVHEVHGEIAHTLMLLDKLKTLGYIVNTDGKRSERWVIASDYDMDMSKLKDMFLLNKSINDKVDNNMKKQMARLILDEHVTLGELIPSNTRNESLPTKQNLLISDISTTV